MATLIEGALIGLIAPYLLIGLAALMFIALNAIVWAIGRIIDSAWHDVMRVIIG